MAAGVEGAWAEVPIACEDDVGVEGVRRPDGATPLFEVNAEEDEVGADVGVCGKVQM